MATPVARSLLASHNAALRFVRAQLISRSDAAAVKERCLLVPGGGIVLLEPCQFQNPSCARLSRQVAASAAHLLGRWSPLVGGEDRRGLGREYRLTAEDELEMRRGKEVSYEKNSIIEYGNNVGDWGDIDKADFDDDDGDDDEEDDGDDGDDDDDDDDDDANVDEPRKRRK